VYDGETDWTLAMVIFLLLSSLPFYYSVQEGDREGREVISELEGAEGEESSV